MPAQMIHNEKGQINIVFNEQQKKEQKNLNNIESLKHIDNYFSSFIGLNSFKRIIKEIYANYLINQKRKQFGLTENKQVLHMMFTGNPGTGKTTVARTLAALFYELNILSKGHFIEVDRSDLVGEYIGQTAQKTKQMIQKALGGILFIDEAYSLSRGGHKDFGREAIDTIVKQMEDYYEDFILILAGYPKEMNDFLQLNPGLNSRFPFIINFNDYKVDELINIAKIMSHKKQYELTNEAKWVLKLHLQTILNSKTKQFSNGRYMRNVIEKAIRSQATRLLKENKFNLTNLTMITHEDLAFLNNDC